MSLSNGVKGFAIDDVKSKVVKGAIRQITLTDGSVFVRSTKNKKQSEPDYFWDNIPLVASGVSDKFWNLWNDLSISIEYDGKNGDYNAL